MEIKDRHSIYLEVVEYTLNKHTGEPIDEPFLTKEFVAVNDMIKEIEESCFGWGNEIERSDVIADSIKKNLLAKLSQKNP